MLGESSCTIWQTVVRNCSLGTRADFNITHRNTGDTQLTSQCFHYHWGEDDGTVTELRMTSWFSHNLWLHTWDQINPTQRAPRCSVQKLILYPCRESHTCLQTDWAGLPQQWLQVKQNATHPIFKGSEDTSFSQSYSFEKKNIWGGQATTADLLAANLLMTKGVGFHCGVEGHHIFFSHTRGFCNLPLPCHILRGICYQQSLAVMQCHRRMGGAVREQPWRWWVGGADAALTGREEDRQETETPSPSFPRRRGRLHCHHLPLQPRSSGIPWFDYSIFKPVEWECFWVACSHRWRWEESQEYVACSKCPPRYRITPLHSSQEPRYHLTATQTRRAQQHIHVFGTSKSNSPLTTHTWS